MGDLKEAPAVHFNFPLLSFSLYITFKSGLPLPVSLFLRNRGGLVIGLNDWSRIGIQRNSVNWPEVESYENQLMVFVYYLLTSSNQ